MLSQLAPKLDRSALKFDLEKDSQDFMLKFGSYFKVGLRSVYSHAQVYLKGLFVTERRSRNIERMQEATGESNYESQQYLISESKWDTGGLLKAIAKNVSRELSKLGIVGCSIDEKAHLKKGDSSVGVARQYAGVVGKVANSQVGVYLSLCADKYASISNVRLFLPQSWTNDRARMKKAGVPKDKRTFKTKPELALEMIQEHRRDGVHFDYVNGDGLYGNSYPLHKGLNREAIPYVLDAHKKHRIFLEKPVIGVPDKKVGKGRTPTRLKATGAAIKISQYVETLGDKDFTKVHIRQTTKGWLKAYIHIARIWVWDEASGDTEAFCQTIVIRKPVKKGDKSKYSLSNIAPEAQPPEAFAFMQAQRVWIEKVFKDDSHELGMSDYQVRKWKGWHNHMVLTFLAMLFVMEQRIKYKQQVPLLSYNDARKLLVSLILNRAKDFDKTVESLEKRHRQRARDILRYYENQEILI